MLDPTTRSPFSTTVRTLRRAAGLTQREVAATLGISHAWYNKLEASAGTSASFGLICRLAALLDTTPNALAGLPTPTPTASACAHTPSAAA